MNDIAVNEQQAKLIEAIHRKEREFMEVLEQIPYCPALSNARQKLHACVDQAIKAATQIRN